MYNTGREFPSVMETLQGNSGVRFNGGPIPYKIRPPKPPTPSSPVAPPSYQAPLSSPARAGVSAPQAAGPTPLSAASSPVPAAAAAAPGAGGFQGGTNGFTMDPTQAANFGALVGQQGPKLPDGFNPWEGVNLEWFKENAPNLYSKIQDLMGPNTTGLGVTGQYVMAQLFKSMQPSQIYSDNDIRNAALATQNGNAAAWHDTQGQLASQAALEGAMDSGAYGSTLNRAAAQADAANQQATMEQAMKMIEANRQLYLNRLNSAIQAAQAWASNKRAQRQQAAGMSAAAIQAQGQADAMSTQNTWGLASGILSGVGSIAGMAATPTKTP